MGCWKVWFKFQEDVPQYMLANVGCSTDHLHGPVTGVSNDDQIMGFRALSDISTMYREKNFCLYCRFRAGALGRENCWVNSWTDSCASALTPPLSAPLSPARVGIDDEDEDVEEEPSLSVRKVSFISRGSEVSTLRVAKGLAPSMEDRRTLAAL